MGFLPSSKWILAFSLLSLGQAAIVLALEIFIFIKFHLDIKDGVTHDRDDPATTIPTFLALYIFAFVYQLILVWDALRMKNTIQVIGLVGMNIGLLIYGAVQVDQLHEAVYELESTISIDSNTWSVVHPILIAIPCIIAAFTLAIGFVAYKLYNEFAWTIYKHISADLRMKRRYLTYQIYIALLKFDFFFCLGFTIQFVVIVGGRNKAERILTGCAIPVTIVIMLAAFLFTRREIMWGTIVVIVLYFAGLAYFCFKLFRMYQPIKELPYLAARKELTTFAVLTIFLMTATIIVAIMCAMNYGKGLKPYVMHGNTKAVVTPNNRPGFEEMHGSPSAYQPGTPAAYPMQNDSYPQKPNAGRQARMEID